MQPNHRGELSRAGCAVGHAPSRAHSELLGSEDAYAIDTGPRKKTQSIPKNAHPAKTPLQKMLAADEKALAGALDSPDLPHRRREGGLPAKVPAPVMIVAAM